MSLSTMTNNQLKQADDSPINVNMFCGTHHLKSCSRVVSSLDTSTTNISCSKQPSRHGESWTWYHTRVALLWVVVMFLATNIYYIVDRSSTSQKVISSWFLVYGDAISPIIPKMYPWTYLLLYTISISRWMTCRAHGSSSTPLVGYLVHIWSCYPKPHWRYLMLLVVVNYITTTPLMVFNIICCPK